MNSGFTFLAAIGIGLCTLLRGGAQAATLDSGWWVILGSVALPDNNFTPDVEVRVRRIEAAARRCGLQPFQDFSSKFRGFSPGYSVVVLGAYSSEAKARSALAKAKPCVSDAYIKRGLYAGE